MTFGRRRHVTKQNKVYALWSGAAMMKMVMMMMGMMGMVTTADGCSGVQFISVGQTTKRAKTVNRNSHTSIRVTLVNF